MLLPLPRPGIAELEEQKNAIKVEHSEVSAAEPGMKICPVCGAESDTASSVPKCGAPDGLTQTQEGYHCVLSFQNFCKKTSGEAVLWAALVFARNRGIA